MQIFSYTLVLDLLGGSEALNACAMASNRRMSFILDFPVLLVFSSLGSSHGVGLTSLDLGVCV